MAVAGILPHHVERPIRPVPIQHDQHGAERLRRLARDSLRVDRPHRPLRGIACRMAVSAEHGSAAATSSAASGARVILSPASVLLRLKLRRLTDRFLLSETGLLTVA